MNAVRVVAAGDALLAPSVTRRLLADFASHGSVAPRPSPASLQTLTAREHQTLSLLAKGMSNAEIGRALVVSEHTVKTHVGNVLMKLGLRGPDPRGDPRLRGGTGPAGRGTPSCGGV